MPPLNSPVGKWVNSWTATWRVHGERPPWALYLTCHPGQIAGNLPELLLHRPGFAQRVVLGVGRRCRQLSGPVRQLGQLLQLLLMLRDDGFACRHLPGRPQAVQLRRPDTNGCVRGEAQQQRLQTMRVAGRQEQEQQSGAGWGGRTSMQPSNALDRIRSTAAASLQMLASSTRSAALSACRSSAAAAVPAVPAAPRTNTAACTPERLSPQFAIALRLAAQPSSGGHGRNG